MLKMVTVPACWLQVVDDAQQPGKSRLPRDYEAVSRINLRPAGVPEQEWPTEDRPRDGTSVAPTWRHAQQTNHITQNSNAPTERRCST